MKTITKKIISLAICAIMVFGTISVCGVIDFKAFAASGSCGTNLTWSYNSDTNELVISGTGAMEDYTYSSSYSNRPWYSYRDKITKVTIEDSVTSIGDRAFYYCTSLTSITIPDSVTSIGDRAFYYCTSLTSITIPDSVTSIGSYAFDGCTGLTSITIPDSVTSIGYCAFDGCTGLKTVYYTGDIAKWCAIDFSYSNPTYYASELYINGSKVEGKLKIPDGVTSIGDYAFYGCKGLTSITIPDSVTSIGGGAFYGCKGLTSITIPNSVTSIGYETFYKCTGLTSITIPDSVTSIGESAFSSCTGLKTVYYTGTPTPWSKISIGSYNSDLTSATIVYECNSDKSYSQGGVCGDDLFYKFYTDTGELIICGTGAMTHYSWSTAPWYSYKDKITKVTIEDGVTTIGNYAFYDCTGLTSITIGNSVTSIGDWAFDGCTSLVNITIPDSVTCVYNGTFEDTAYYNDETKWENGKVLYIGNHLIKAKDTLSGNYEIKKGTKDISDYAFYGCTSLTEITIPDSVVTIGESAFKECSCLLSVSIGNGVKTIGGYAFDDCKSLKDVNLGNNITTIGGGAFNECTNIKSITIPDSVTSIGGGAFYKTGLTSVKIPRTVTSIGEGAFGSTSDFFGYIYDRDFTIYCEKGSEAHRYAAANDLNCVLVNDASTGNNSSNGSNSGSSSLSFFQRIIAFFKGIFQSIKNLFS